MIGGRLVVPKGISRPPYHRYNRAERQIYLSAYHIAPHTVDAYVDGLEAYRPSVFTGYAYAHYLLGRMMIARGRRLSYSPDALILGSERWYPSITQRTK